MKRRILMKTLAAAVLACTVSVFAEGTAATPATAPAPIKGNKQTKVYHQPSCRHYKAKSCTVEFKTEADASKAGYTPCKRCSTPKKEKKTKPAAAASETTE